MLVSGGTVPQKPKENAKRVSFKTEHDEEEQHKQEVSFEEPLAEGHSNNEPEDREETPRKHEDPDVSLSYNFESSFCTGVLTYILILSQSSL